MVRNLNTAPRKAGYTVVQLLITKYGIAADRLQPHGDGPYSPLSSNDTEDGRAVNRRVELVKQ